MKNKYSVVVFGFVIEVTLRKQAKITHDEWPWSDWKATHQHRKGGEYRRLCGALLEVDKSPVVVYDDKVGNIWVRSKTEFDDGRFAMIDNQ